MKYYSEITKKMYDTHEELDKAEEGYKKELISKAKEEEEQKEKLKSARKIRDEKRKEYTSSILACNRALSELKEADANVKDIENSISHKKSISSFSAYANIDGKEFYSEGEDAWRTLAESLKKYVDKKFGL